ncbi:hypothetical protein JL721_3355 [Aureococcus anophagefferens]|nr:hypothetical protein JL721_3355 [Aureococcus anophagefferens]
MVSFGLAGYGLNKKKQQSSSSIYKMLPRTLASAGASARALVRGRSAPSLAGAAGAPLAPSLRAAAAAGRVPRRRAAAAPVARRRRAAAARHAPQAARGAGDTPQAKREAAAPSPSPRPPVYARAPARPEPGPAPVKARADAFAPETPRAAAAPASPGAVAGPAGSDARPPPAAPPGAPAAAAEHPLGPCDKCDGPHATSRCPHFAKDRDDHPDAQRAKGLACGADGGNAYLRRGEVIRQPGDGSCLFHSLAYGLRLQNRHGDARQLRRELMDWLSRNPDASIADTPVGDWVKWDSNCSVDDYTARMRGAGWAAASRWRVRAGVGVHLTVIVLDTAHLPQVAK